MGLVLHQKIYIIRYNISVIRKNSVLLYCFSIISLLYTRKPSSSIIVYALNLFGKFFVHLPFIMHSDFDFSNPHGPCIINCFTASLAIGSLSRSGISAIMIQSMSVELGHLSFGSKNRRICAYGSPHFWNSIVYTIAITLPK